MSHEYLSDEELQKLISDVEFNDMAEAPVDLQKKVLDEISALSKSGNIAKTKKQKIIEYRLYSLKVALAVAAAIAVMFIVPQRPVIDRDIPTKEEYLAEMDIFTRQGLFDTCRNRDEVLEENNLCKTLVQKREEIETRFFDMFNR
ncbi:hypothetical protein [Butyrivibrio sp. M55]|uniref:hypothetical protein n=1 Tax=Butyrivibrio sp. M55 TaxID=1855323 RepID=UPI0008EAE753|nr:hypothetical protein [Butyrivibrio sp. M55]SFU42909.1 hypothetical protein SAMN05216540_10272 [Butyrivibrio sp. M55]